MSETCKTCKKEFTFGIWLSPQSPDEKVLLFCSEVCKKKYIEMKLRRIKEEYPKYYDKVINLVKSSKKKGVPFWLLRKKDGKR